MQKIQHVHKYILITFILLVSNSMFSQKIVIDNYIIIDPLLQDEETKSLSSKHYQNEEYENTWWFLHNRTEVLYFDIIQSVYIKEIIDPIEDLSIAGFIRLAEQRYKETDTLKNRLYWHRGYLSDFIFNNLYIKILNTETNKAEYFKVNFSYAERIY